jgi:hypothetical protein
MKLLTCNYQGRLGNLMFEIAATISTAYNNGLTPSFVKEYHRYYNDIPAFLEYILPIVKRFHQHHKHHTFTDYQEPADLLFKPISVTEDTRLVGYFTSSKYFNQHRKQIIDIFTSDFKEEVNRAYDLIRSLYPERQLVTVHIRRTDYVTDYGWDLPLSYYEQAARHFDNPVFVIFSDDHDWCKANLTFMQDKVFVNNKDYIELLLMGRFDAQIAANSTFSAMGIILGDPGMNKKVIAPEKWSPTLFNKDIYEPHWTII